MVTVTNSYEKLKPYWEAWKSNNEQISDPQESENREEMFEIFKAVAGQPSAKVNQDALNFILESLPRWRSDLLDLPDGDKLTNRIKLYRGIGDCQAILLRKAFKDGVDWCERVLVPISYSTNIDAAFGFASKGHINGAVYSVCVSTESVLFSDLDGYYEEGGMHHEREVVVWYKSPLAVNLINPNVSVRQPLTRTPSAREQWEREKKRLENKEKFGPHDCFPYGFCGLYRWTIEGLRATVRTEVHCKQRVIYDCDPESQAGA